MSSPNTVDWLRSGEVDIAQHFVLADRPRTSPGVRCHDRAGTHSELRALHVQAAPRRASGPSKQARSPGACPWHRPPSPHPGQPLRRRRPDAATCRKRRLPSSEPALQAEVEHVPAQSGGRETVPRAGGVSTRLRRDLLLRGRAALAQVVCECRPPRPGAGGLARPGPAETQRRRGGTDLRPLRRVLRRRSSRAATSTSRTSRGLVPVRIRPEPTSCTAAEASRTTAAIASGW